ncbi:MAG TPA: bifunctional precorrin-2 dehydrogenase/sirohydrochlorin ferrochelatase, partial [Chitinispirillaceae bacterium]|nr:bifunctional precorrin-2 dehydrogenase/sirohydrochlorin ferrochelatase [Chitinispirillaceae bacterium]
LVVGGGAVALRKVISLLRSGATVTVIATVFHRHFNLIASRIIMIERAFDENDIYRKFTLVIGATDIAEVNQKISEKAAQFGIPCNIVDQPQLCSFIVPAVVNRGDITIAISTNAKSPRLSRYIKNEVARIIGPEYAQLASYMAAIRITVRSVLSSPQNRSSFWEKLFEIDPMEYIHLHGWREFCNRTDQLINEFKQKQDKYE